MRRGCKRCNTEDHLPLENSPCCGLASTGPSWCSTAWKAYVTPSKKGLDNVISEVVQLDGVLKAYSSSGYTFTAIQGGDDRGSAIIVTGNPATGSPVRPRRAFEITIIGPHKKKHLWTVHGQLTLAALQEEINRHFPDAVSADYTLTWETSNDIVDDFEGTVSQWGEQNKITVELKLKLLSKGFSDFTRADGLEYLGFSRSYEINEAAETEFTAEELADDAAVNGQTSTFGSLLQHFAEDLCLRRSALGCPETKPSEQTRREIISPVFVLAVLLMTGMRLVAEARVQGSLGNGPLDYAVIWEAFKVLISECKKERLEDGEGQALAQTAAAREEYVRKRVKGIKRKRSEIDKDLPVPSTTILSTGTTYIFYRYHPAAGEAQPRRLVKSKEYTLDLIGPTSPETIKPQLKVLVCAIVASLRFEKENIEAALASKKLKLMD
ncbi:hypothetical protein WJX72_006924 [[Myrmecia] bisecta]|uniref:Uncharacterized protein n=1 Tax=[Myrmecia] bisecta TaxID=41462 RepID=A0AAW1P3A3_9CHLO